VIRVPYLRLVKASSQAIVEYDRLRRNADEWLDTLERLGIAYGASPLTPRTNTRTWWLPASKQLILVVSRLTKATIAIAEDFDQQLAHYVVGAHLDELDDDIRVVVGLSGGRFFGLRGGSYKVHSAAGLYRCDYCRGAWFLTEWGSWACRCCGYYRGNAGVRDRFTDVVPLPADWRHSQ
jgi:hypothetical protein